MSQSTQIQSVQHTSTDRGGEGKNPRATVAQLLAEPGSEAPEVVDPRGLYIHIPFCFHKCHYCDFYSIVDRADRQGRFIHRLIAELEAARVYITGPIETVFIGGGTPTLLAPYLWRSLLEALRSRIPMTDDLEFTVEANPETVTDELIRILRSGGVNRLSIGAQSFDRMHLRTLERWHDPENVARSVDAARCGGIDNVSLDLIFGIPGQTLNDWQADLDAALELAPDHLSAYGLMYEPNTPMTARLRAGRITRVDDEVEAAMYEATLDRLDAAGFEHYEISNWARPGRRCRHNLLYWRNEQWWPLGPSASGHAGGWRWKNRPRLAEYLDSGPLPPIVDAERLDADGRIGEELMLGLRLTDGISTDRLDALLGAGARGRSRRSAVDRFIAAGLLVRSGDVVRLSRRGLLLADTVLAELL
jgi:oxygen-independent coproporphyrinogen-3 oxidase